MSTEKECTCGGIAVRKGPPLVPRGATISEAADHCVDRFSFLNHASDGDRLAYYRSLLAVLDARSTDQELSDPGRRRWFEGFRDSVVTAIGTIVRTTKPTAPAA